MKVLYRVITNTNGRFDVLMRDDEGRWSCVNFNLATFERASEIAEKYRAEEEGCK